MKNLLPLNPGILAPLPVLIAVHIITAIIKLILWRIYFLRLRARGLNPMPPYSVFLGHLTIVNKIISSLPSDAHGHYLPDQIRCAYPELGPNYYLDLAPFAPPMLVLTSPDTLQQVTQLHPLEKFPNMRTFLNPLTGGFDMVTMTGQTWKKWRGVFNPGFSAAHLMTLVPSIVKKTERFCCILREHAKTQDVVLMKTLTDNLKMDIIGEVVLDQDFDCQRSPNELVDGIRKQIRWLSFGVEPNLFTRYHPLRPFIHWYYGSRVNAIVSQELENRCKKHYSQGKDKRSRSVVELALKAYDSEKVEHGPEGAKDISPLFRKIFLKLVQQELDTVFSPDQGRISQLISENPHLLNSIPYTTAVIRGSLRLFPTVSSTRDGEPGFLVEDSQGRKFPTEDFLVWVNPHAVQHSPELWDQPDDFIPERWLGERRRDIKTGAWRAFEHGPRNCIGQELAILESKVVLCNVAREFIVQDVYEEGGNKVNGEPAYQVQLSQPAGDLPCRIRQI